MTEGENMLAGKGEAKKSGGLRLEENQVDGTTKESQDIHILIWYTSAVISGY